MKYNKITLLQNAFEVFLEKGYENTSISTLQKELNMSRGAIYCYFKNKEDLFCSVIDQYFFRIYNRIIQQKTEDMTVSELINYMYRRQRLSIILFRGEKLTSIEFLNYTALLIQAAKYYPNFLLKYRNLRIAITYKWKKAIENSLEKNEIKEDTNIPMICNLFNRIFLSETLEESYHNSPFTLRILDDIEKRKLTLNYLYSLIKK